MKTVWGDDKTDRKHFQSFVEVSFVMSALSIKLHLNSDDIRRFSFERDASFDALMRYVERQYLQEQSFALSYTDDEGDQIALS